MSRYFNHAFIRNHHYFCYHNYKLYDICILKLYLLSHKNDYHAAKLNKNWAIYRCAKELFITRADEGRDRKIHRKKNFVYTQSPLSRCCFACFPFFRDEKKTSSSKNREKSPCGRKGKKILLSHVQFSLIFTKLLSLPKLFGICALTANRVTLFFKHLGGI